MKRLVALLVSLLASLSVALALVAPALAQSASASDPFTVIASGLNNPRGIAIGPNGAIYVAEAGNGGAGPCVTSSDGGQRCLGKTGSITRIMNGQQQRIVTDLPSVAGPDGTRASGPSGIAVDSAGNAWVTVQGVVDFNPVPFGSAGSDLWHILRVDANCRCQTLTNLYPYEATHNPDGREISSNPSSIVSVSNGEVVADAGANALLHVDSNGNVSTLAVFPVRMVKGPDGTNVPIESAPDAVAVGPDGAYYVGEMTRSPFPIVSARIYRIAAEGGEPQVFASGFANIAGLAFGRDGSMYVLEMFTGGSSNASLRNPASAAGALIRVAGDGTRTTLATDGLIAPAGLTIAPNGSIYVTDFGIFPSRGQVVRMNALASATISSTSTGSSTPATSSGSRPLGSPSGGNEVDLNGSASGALVGDRNGASATYTVAYPTAGKTQTVTLSFSPVDAASAIYVNVYQNGNLLVGAEGTEASPPGQLKVSYSSTTAGPVQIQISNFNPNRTVIYTISD